MRRTIFFATFVLLITTSVSNVQAQTFSAISPSGHTLYYQGNNEDSYYSGGIQYNSVMVVLNNIATISWDIAGDTSLHGAVVIPDSVMYGSRKYAVTRIKCFWAPNITNLTIPNTVRKIDAEALSMCGFSTLTIPVGVTSFGGGIAFNCPNLTTVYYNARRANVPSSYCGNLFSWTVRNVIIGDSVEYIPKCFCSNRDSLRSVTILGHVKSIGRNAFYYCRSLHTVSVVGSIDTIGENAFYHCDSLRSIVIPKTVVEINNNAFAYCSHLDTVFYNAKLCTSRYESYESPFYNTNIQMLCIGDSVQRINIYTFSTAPQSVVSKAIVPPVLYLSTSGGSYVTNGRIFIGAGTNVVVPCGSLDAYQSKYAWSNNNISDNCVNVVGVANNGSFGTVVGGATCSPNTPLTLYALPSAGYTFVGWTDSNYDNPRDVISISEDIAFTAIFSPKDTVLLHDTMVVVDTLTQYVAIHDTTFIDVPYAVHDTTIVTDTLTLTEYVDIHDTIYLDVHDTTYINVPYAVHDTTILVNIDTVYLPQYIHDTTTITLKDTTYLPVFLYDTIYFDVHDTTYIDVQYAVHDTTFIEVFVHDTAIVIDTLTLIEYIPVHDTTILVNIDTIYLPQYIHDTTTITFNDTTYLPVFLYDTIYFDVHDTTYIDVQYTIHDTTYIDVFVHDTALVIDTLTVYVPVHDTTFFSIHDTTYIDLPYAVHDTTILVNNDTVYLPQYIHDTTTIILTDTTYLPVYLYDTTYIDIHDTTYIDNPYAVHDTTYIDVPYAVHDTTYIDIYVHDTTTLTDTVTLTEYVPVHDTTIVSLYDTTYITIHDTTYITQTDTVTNTMTIYDTITNTVIDTVTNTIYDTTIIYSTDTIWLHDTVFVHDTIFSYDTIYVGVDEVETISAKIYPSNGQIVVDGTHGKPVRLFDVNGRILDTKQDEYLPLHFDVSTSGTYIVKISNHPARKVVVIK